MSTTALGPPETRPGERRQPPSGGDPGIRVDRTCTEIRSNGSHDNSTEARQLTDFRAVPAYVLLGDPGAGKTTEFEKESEALGDAALMLPARNLRDFSPADHPEWWNKILFIDGLDEMRTGTADAATALGAIRGRLDQLGKPDFRISCREADWLGPNDIEALRDVSRTSQVTLLRLDPLSPSAIREMLGSRKGLRNVSTFLGEALRRGVYSMLGNPLTLDLLAKAVQEGETWPEGRQSTFEIGCRTMTGEHPDGRRDASAMPPTEIVLEVAGYVCSLLLLSDKQGVTLKTGSDSPAFVSLHDLGGYSDHPSEQNLRATLGTRLFQGADDMRFVPLHRQVAEFLAGRYLARRIDAGLPAQRVVALMTGPSDGRVVTVFRGLSAWLATHSRDTRQILVDVDPVGVALYGDIRGFATNDKERLLRALAQLTPHEPIFDYEHPGSPNDTYRTDTAWAFRSLASTDMVEPIKRLLNPRGAEAADERLQLLVLDALSKAERSETESLGELRPMLEQLVRDVSRTRALRRSALDAYRHILPEHERTQALLQVLGELEENADSDMDGELRGTLLSDLYPTAISPTQIWRYALGPYQHHFLGRFRLFWNDGLLERSSDEQFLELLDALSDDAARLIPVVRRASGFADLPLNLLDHGLMRFGGTLDPRRVDRWLRIVGVYDWRSDGNSQPMRRIRARLTAHPREQTSAFLIRLRHRPAEESTRSWAWREFDPVLRGTFSTDFGLWCLEKGIEIGDAEPILSRRLLTHSFVSLQNPSINEGLSLDVMRERTSNRRDLARELEQLCTERAERERPTPDSDLPAPEELLAERREEERQHREEWAQYVRANETELPENRFSPRDLHHLAKVYLGLFSDSNADLPPRRRIAEFVGEDEVAVDLALAGLRSVIRRDGIPDVKETISLHLESQQSWLAYPVLASLHLLDEEDPASLDNLDARVKRKALAIRYCVPFGDPHPRVGHIVWIDGPAWNDPPDHDQPRGWHDRWLDQDPELVLDVLYRCAAAGIRAGKDFPPGLSELAGITDHDDLVHEVRLKLLKAIPTRGRGARLPLLDGLLAKVLNHPDWTELRQLVELRLSQASINVGQRVRWLAAEAVISPSPGLPRLKMFVGDSEVRAQHLAAVLQHPVEHVRRTSDQPRSIRSILANSGDPETLAALVEMLGPFFGPTGWGGYVTLEMAMSEHIRNLIEKLGALAGDDATEALGDLVGDVQLASWHGHLEGARERQRVVCRDTSYRHPSIDEIRRTLDNSAPANAADLAALLSVRLADIAADIQGGSSNRWRQFWNEDSYGRVLEDQPAKPEDSCRDAILSALELYLPSEVDATREGHYAADRRADVRAACHGFNVPVEIKKNSHRELWSALHTQLIATYTNDPDTDGYGLYLVLWFGADQTTRCSDGTLPATPKEVENLLRDHLTPDEARKISVIVMDVTKPGDRQESSAASEPRLH